MGKKQGSTAKVWGEAIGKWAFLILVIALPTVIGLWGFIDSVILRAIRG